MKKIKSVLIPIFFGLVLSSCGGASEQSSSTSYSASSDTSQHSDSSELSTSSEAISSSEVSESSEMPSSSEEIKKANIKIEKNQYMVTTLLEGEYELNKTIDFTVNGVNEEYRVTSVKMNDVELPPSNGNQYAFTPTEVKEYVLKVVTEELDNVILYTFNDLKEETYNEQLTKKGTRLNVNNDGMGFEDLFKNCNLTLKNGQKIVFLFNDAHYGKRVLINKITFTFVSGKENLTFEKAIEKEEYVDGVYTYKSEVFDEDRADLIFSTKGDIAISKIVVETVPYVPYNIKLQFNNLGNDDKVYFLNGPTFEEYQNKKEVTSDSEFIAGQAYYLYVEWGKDRKTYYSGLEIKYKDEHLKKFNFYPSDESGLPKDEIVTYLLTPMKEESKINVLDLIWVPKEATNNIKVDIASANKYVKHFMETDPLGSLGLIGAYYGTDVIVTSSVKKGYHDLKLLVNDVVISKDEETNEYKFKVPFSNPINISFNATEGDEDRVGRVVVSLTGDNEDKGVLLVDYKDDQAYIVLDPSEDHPTAYITSIYYRGRLLPKQTSHDPEEGDKNYYVLTKEETEYFKDYQDKASLFVVSIEENNTYTSSLIFNQGNFKAEVIGKEYSEEGKYEVAGKSNVTIKITPNENLDIHSIEVNDKRLAESAYVVNQDGSVTYTFTANAKNYDFFIQTKAQVVKLELDEGSTKGYIIKDLPTEPVNCGQAINLTLGVTDEGTYWLFGKKITVTYNGVELPVDENNFTFTIVPIKGISKIKVIVENKPQ